MGISFKLNGRTVPANRLGAELEKAMQKQVTDAVVQSVRSVRCPIHGQTPRVMGEQRVGSRITWKISGCCDAVIEKARARLL